ncbi:MAG: hypothetical protein ACFFBR_10790 [Promethearchaeota archaeon]
MGDAETASTLSLIAGILQLIFSLVMIGMGCFMVLLFLPLMIDPMIMMVMGAFLGLFLIFPIMGGIGLIFAVLWFNWRQFPGEHKTGLIVSGIIALLTIGFIPGLLALIAGAIAPTPSAYRGYVPAPTPPPRPTVKVITRCPHCGADTTGADDRFCWRCGAAL